MYVWLYKGRFSLPPATHNTKGESIEYQTPILTGRFLPRKSDGQWRAKVKTGDATVPANIGDTWFTEVYEKTAAPTV
jgi:phi13 family phage major tail protein